MTFLTAQTQLKGFVYNEDDLREARMFLTQAITKHAPDWLQEPRGILARYWNNDAPPGVLAVIDVARTLYDLTHTATNRSQPILVRKSIELLNTEREQRYEELLAELRVGALFGTRARPIAFEPLVPEELIGSAAQPPSPDYGIRLPGGDVQIEVTTLYVDALDGWERAMTDIHERISAVLDRIASQGLF